MKTGIPLLKTGMEQVRVPLHHQPCLPQTMAKNYPQTQVKLGDFELILMDSYGSLQFCSFACLFAKLPRPGDSEVT